MPAGADLGWGFPGQYPGDTEMAEAWESPGQADSYKPSQDRRGVTAKRKARGEPAVHPGLETIPAVTREPRSASLKPHSFQGPEDLHLCSLIPPVARQSVLYP